MNLFASIFVSTVLALVALLKHALTPKGVLLAWIFAIIIAFWGGPSAFLLLTLTFLATLVASKIKGEYRHRIMNEISVKHGPRDAVQVLANVGVATFTIVLYHLTGKGQYPVVYACVLAASLADTFASDFGVVTKGVPFDLCTLKKIPPGISGGVTWRGFLFSLCGATIIALAYALMTDFRHFFFILLLGFVGSFLDSIFGSLFQEKYQCSDCHKITEQKIHCQKETLPIRGVKGCTNDMVNILNNIATFLLAVFLI